MDEYGLTDEQSNIEKKRKSNNNKKKKKKPKKIHAEEKNIRKDDLRQKK